MSEHPYKSLPDRAFWKRSVAGIEPSQIDPVGEVPFRIARTDKVATAGSCFAQHISRRLSESGYTFLVTEPAHPIADPADAQEFNYGVFTARYGNVYTARQLVQLLERAYGTFQPQEDAWEGEDGRLIDPFRPQIQPGGFRTQREYDVDRAKHLAAVREAFETADVFIFTLGLTEAWMSQEDGAVYPLCPGVAGGTFDESRYRFHNFTAAEVTVDLLRFIDELRRVNPAVRVVLTVSPVPLMATATDQHVLTATSYSKAVLRVAADQAVAARADVLYFPSYEIVMGTFARGAYFEGDLRSVTEAGVNHVMRTFFRRLGEDQADAAPVARVVPPPAENHLERMARAAALNCDEEALDRSRPEQSRIESRGAEQPRTEEPRVTVVPRRRRHI
ncbi:MAG TPA: GSCFA domain-containing protein [Pirellulaceae bacterium]|jgi:hypothetical protein|nr:GSCFA domain-containing protein [Pirellulaceae bacterium]